MGHADIERQGGQCCNGQHNTLGMAAVNETNIHKDLLMTGERLKKIAKIEDLAWKKAVPDASKGPIRALGSGNGWFLAECGFSTGELGSGQTRQHGRGKHRLHRIECQRQSNGVTSLASLAGTMAVR